MKKLMIGLMILGIAGMAWGEFTVGGHSNPQIAVIGLTATGAVVTARFTANLLPIKDPAKKAAARALFGMASGYMLYRLSERMTQNGAQYDHATMYHAAKDGGALTGGISFSLSVWDTWKLLKAEKKK